MPSASVIAAAAVNPGLRAKLRGAVGEVLAEIGDPAECPRIAVMFLRLLDAAECAPRGEARRLRRQTLVPKVLFEQREVRRHLPREVVFGTAGTNRGHDPQQEPPQRVHDYDSSRSLSTRPARRRHFSVSFSSAFSPLLVML